MIDLVRRLRPGSGGKGPVSDTMGPDRKRGSGGKRPTRRPGTLTRPDGVGSDQSWPVAIATNTRGEEVTTPVDVAERLEAETSASADDWDYELDDSEVMRKLFRVDV